MSDAVGIALIGAGRWGKHYARLFDGPVQGARLVAIAERQESRRAAVAHRHAGARVVAEARDAIDDAGVSAVVIATPAATHHEIARAALEAGRHVLVEKPFALEPEHARELAALAEQKGRVLLVGHTFLYNPAVRRMKEIVRDERFGELYYLAARRTNLGPIRADASVVSDLAAHDVAIFGYLLDAEPTRVSAVGGCFLEPGRADAAFITLAYPGGVVGHIQVSWVDSHKIREVVAIGSRRRVAFDDLHRLEPLRVFDKGVTAERGGEGFGEFQYELRDGDITSPQVATDEPLRVLAAHFIACIRDGAAPLTGSANGLAVVRTIDAIERSLARGGAPVDLARGA